MDLNYYYYDLDGSTIKKLDLNHIDPTLRSSTDIITHYYERLSYATKLTSRAPQLKLSMAAYDIIMQNKVLCAEAPTGTGKTIAYLLAALAAANEKDLPIIVATANVALQQQIINDDAPRLIAAGFLKPKDIAIAKGRGRYFCINNAESLTIEDGIDKVLQEDLFKIKNDIQQKKMINLKVVDRLITSYKDKTWDGCKDTLSGEQCEEEWPEVNANRDTCLGQNCDYYDNCAFFKARGSLAHAKLIIANHDMVISELELRKEGKSSMIALDQKFILIFDEGHHLPDKAVHKSEKSCNLDEQQIILKDIDGWLKRIFKTVELKNFFESKGKNYKDANAKVTSAQNHLYSCLSFFQENPIENNKIKHYERGTLPSLLKTKMEKLSMDLSYLYLMIEEMFADLLSLIKTGKDVLFKEIALNLMRDGSTFKNKLSHFNDVINYFSNNHKMVRWAKSYKNMTYIHTSFKYGRELLNDILWQRRDFSVIIVSATLKTLGNFKKFAFDSGLDSLKSNDVFFLSLGHIFPYEKSALVIASDMLFTPKEDDFYVKELAQRLPNDLPYQQKGILLLFHSFKMMKEVRKNLPQSFLDYCLFQGSGNLTELINTHKSRVDSGKGSILVGVSSLAEGLDLPGNYCSMVVLTRLPFSTPDHPVEKEIQIDMKDDYFLKHSLPIATKILQQQVGRLNRRESDLGTILVYDKRLGYKNSIYAPQMKASLPPFTERTISHYLSKVKAFKDNHTSDFIEQEWQPQNLNTSKILTLATNNGELTEEFKNMDDFNNPIW